MADDVETELMALDHCVKALSVLKEDAQQRALRYLQDRFGKKHETSTSPLTWQVGVQTH